MKKQLKTHLQKINQSQDPIMTCYKTSVMQQYQEDSFKVKLPVSAYSGDIILEVNNQNIDFNLNNNTLFFQFDKDLRKVKVEKDGKGLRKFFEVLRIKEKDFSYEIIERRLDIKCYVLSASKNLSDYSPKQISAMIKNAQIKIIN